MLTKRSGGWDGVVALDFGGEPEARRSPVPLGATRNVILLIGDGMGFGQVTLARNELVGPNRRLAMERASYVGWLSTHDVGRLYTDSASTATTLATGHKTFRTAVGVDADGLPRRSLAEAARDSGRSVGLVTDSYLWDATPGAFGAHVSSRTQYEEVARQLAASDFDLLVGGSTRDKGDYRDLFGAGGWRVFDQFEPWLEALPSSVPLVGIFEDLSQPVGPTLLEVARAAAERLDQDSQGFFLLVEAEEIDTGSHRADFGRVVAGVRSLDEVAAWAFDFAERTGDTTVVVTADHDTGSPVVLDGRAGGPQAVRWTSPYHTAQPVPLFAHGPGAERLAGIQDNREVATTLATLLGIDLEPADSGVPREGTE